MDKVDCPLVFVDESIMNNNQLLSKHRLIITELYENYLSYISKKKSAIDCLDWIKSHLKRQSLGEANYDRDAAKEQKVQMCKLLYSK